MRKRYFNKLVKLVNSSRAKDYQKLLMLLYNTPYIYAIPNDENRYEDALALRLEIMPEIDVNQPISVLEVMIALARRIDTYILYDPEFGDRSDVWFWQMIYSLGLISMTDNFFDKENGKRIIDRFLRGDIEANGKGSLFYISGSSFDMRGKELWAQAMAYCNTMI